MERSRSSSWSASVPVAERGEGGAAEVRVEEREKPVGLRGDAHVRTTVGEEDDPDQHAGGKVGTVREAQPLEHPAGEVGLVGGLELLDGVPDRGLARGGHLHGCRDRGHVAREGDDPAEVAGGQVVDELLDRLLRLLELVALHRAGDVDDG